MFIKRGDGKILSVVEDEEMTEQQKKAAKDLSKVVKQSEDADSSEVKKSGANK